MSDELRLELDLSAVVRRPRPAGGVEYSGNYLADGAWREAFGSSDEYSWIDLLVQSTSDRCCALWPEFEGASFGLEEDILDAIERTEAGTLVVRRDGTVTVE